MKQELAMPREKPMRKEYDLSHLKGGIRGKYFKRAMSGSNLVLLDPDLSTVFPDSKSVNRALRLLQDIATKSSKSPSLRRKATG